MPNTLDVRADDRLLRFGDNLRVQEIAPDGSVVQETDWESVSGEKENEISFRFDGETRTSLAVRYAFNARNQLVLTVVAQHGVPAESKAWTLPGQILVDDIEDVEYVLIDEEGNATPNKIVIYARLDFPEGYRRLRVRMPDQSETFITGADKHQSLSAGEYSSGGDLARDLLAFRAVTRNTIQDLEEEAPADIKFYGRWDMHENALVFVTKYDSTGSGSPVGFLAIGGQIRGTNFGLVVEQDGKSAFQIRGRYAWNRTTLGYDLKVGYSKATGLEARLAADAKIVGKKGTLTIAGGATLKKGDQSTEVKFDLSIKYSTQNSRFQFTIGGDAESYEIQFSGDFRVRHGNVKFEIAFSNKDGVPSVRGSVEFGRYTQNSELKASLVAVLSRSGIALEFNLEFRFFWGPSGPVAELPENN
ncbi:MAG: hypothetical protein JNK85_15325 [Verrucomicrobiales bacterium]|nr:hypothetical protein [Verrucomicrobiales bacterium]